MNKKSEPEGPGFGLPPEGASMVFPFLRQSAEVTKIVRASFGLPTLRAGPQFQNSKPILAI